MGKSPRIRPSPVSFSVKLLREDDLDSVNPHRNIRGRQARNLTSRCGIQVFKIRDDDLAIEWLEPLNQG
jgi:hypothetical protein